METTSFFELEAKVLSLGPTERAHLLARLIESFAHERIARDAWIAQARRRHDEVKAGKVAAVPGPEAVAGIRTRLS